MNITLKGNRHSVQACFAVLWYGL